MSLDGIVKQFCVLIVDDEPRILKFLELKLKASGYAVVTAKNGMEGISLLQSEEPDLMVLDVLMPGIDGFDTLEQVRAFSSVPVIILSAKESNQDKVKGLRLGADDYLAKPFNPEELVARIEAIKRRLAPADNRKIVDMVTLGHVTVNLKNHSVSVEGRDIKLTRIEWLLLNEFIRNAGKLLLYGELLSRVWGPEYRDDVQILRTWVSRLRRKIEVDADHPSLIHTVPKTGYMIDQPPAP